MSTESVNLPSRNSLRASRPHTAQVIVFATICYSESPATIALPRNSRTALSLGAGGKHDLRRGDEQRLRVVLQGQRARERVWARAATRAIASPATGPIHRTIALAGTGIRGMSAQRALCEASANAGWCLRRGPFDLRWPLIRWEHLHRKQRWRRRRRSSDRGRRKTSEP